MPSITPKSQALTAARRGVGLTQAEVAERLGVSPSTVCRWERGDGLTQANFEAALTAIVSAAVPARRAS